MRLEYRDDTVVLTLSRRNLLAMLHKLDMPDSFRTIFKDCDGTRFVLKSEDDSEHYGEVLPGEMEESTEEFIKEN